MKDYEVKSSSSTEKAESVKPKVPETVGGGGDLVNQVKKFHDDVFRKMPFKK